MVEKNALTGGSTRHASMILCNTGEAIRMGLGMDADMAGLNSVPM